MIPVLAVHLQQLLLGLRVSDVAEVVWAVAVTPLTDAPPMVEGVIDVRGQMIPLLDPSTRFGLAPVPLALSDRFVIVTASGRRVALRVQSADAVLSLAPGAIRKLDAFAGAGARLAGVAEMDDGLMLVQDLDAFLSESEAAALDEIAAASRGTPS